MTKTPHLSLRVAYEGSAFHGLQWQPHKASIQNELEKVCAQLLSYKKRIRFVSRTDAGVNAWDQVILLEDAPRLRAHLSATQFRALIPSFNALLPPSIRVWSVGEMSAQFDFHRDILWKEYSYFIFNSRIEDPTLGPFVFWKRRVLDIEEMRRQLKMIEGENDFSAFAKNSGQAHRAKKRACVRNLIKTRVLVRSHPRWPESRLIELRFRGDGFLQHMVRNLVGSALGCLEGKCPELPVILKSRDRRQGGQAAPPQALFLREVKIRSNRLKKLL